MFVVILCPTTTEANKISPRTPRLTGDSSWKIPFQLYFIWSWKIVAISFLWQTVSQYCDDITETCATIDSIVFTLWHWTVSGELLSPLLRNVSIYLDGLEPLATTSLHSRKLFHKIPMWILEKPVSPRIPLPFRQHSFRK